MSQDRRAITIETYLRNKGRLQECGKIMILKKAEGIDCLDSDLTSEAPGNIVIAENERVVFRREPDMGMDGAELEFGVE